MIANKTPKQIGFTLASVLLGAWAFVKISSVSGPAFEPIIAACSNPDYKGDMDEFVSKTGYHTYEPLVGLKIFELLVCLITQFLLELRETYPQGFLTWGGVILASLPAVILGVVEAGRGGAKGFIRYNVLMGLLAQLFGISVVFPLLWVPGYILGRGTGPISKRRASAAIPLAIPGILLTVAVFSLDTDSYGWIVSAGMLGGPILAMFSAILWTDAPPSSPSKKDIQGSIASVSKSYNIMTVVGTIWWHMFIYIVHDSYASAGGFCAILGKLWADVWINANASVAFMTIDTIVLYVAVLWCIAFQSLEKVTKAILLTPFMGPAAATLVLGELEETRYIVEEKSDDASKKEK